MALWELAKMDLTDDFTPEKISSLLIHTRDNKIQISTGKNITLLTLAGTLENLEYFQKPRIALAGGI